MYLRFIKQTVLILLLLPTIVLAGEVDLSIEVTSPQGEQTIGTTVPFYFQITNNSNTTATNVVFENDFSSYRTLYEAAGKNPYNVPDLSLVSISPAAGNCELIESIVSCNLGNISAGNVVHIDLKMQIEYVGELGMHAKASSSQIDNNESNNTQEIIISASKNNVETFAELISYNFSDPGFIRGASYFPKTSANGQFISFRSEGYLMPGISEFNNIFTYDRQNQQFDISNISNSGQYSNNGNSTQKMSSDGDILIYYSLANNLVEGDNNQIADLFGHIRSTGETFRISVSNDGVEANSSPQSWDISQDGNYIVFVSKASNLVNDDDNGDDDIFVYNVQSRTISRLEYSHADFTTTSWVQEASVSSNGEYIAFTAWPNKDFSNFVHNLYIWEKETGITKKISISKMPDGSDSGSVGHLNFSDNGKFVVYTGMGGGQYHIYKYSIETNKTELISKAVDQQIENGKSFFPSISNDGRFISFASSSSNLVSNDTNNENDIFAYDSVSNTIKMVSIGIGGFQVKGGSNCPDISSDGSTIAFISHAHNLSVINSDDNRDVTNVYVTKNPFIIEVAKEIDLSIDKSTSASEIEIGNNVTYTLTVDNISVDSEATAAEVSVEDVLPTGLTFESATPSTGTCSENSGTVTCEIGDIAVGDPSITIDIVAKTTETGSITNTATVSAAETDSDTSNNSSEVTITVIELTDIYIDGSIDDSVTYYIGDELSYSFEIGNNSTNPATDVTAEINIPAEISISSAVTDTGTCSTTGQKVTCIVGNISTTDANITVKATPSAAGNFDVVASVTTAKTDSDTDNNTDTVTVTIKPKADIAISVSDSSDPIYAGNNLTYTITVKNNGPSDTTNIQVTDTLPTGVTFVSASAGCTEATGIVTCDLGNLANGASTSVNVVIKPTKPGTITNSVTVSATEYDPVAANNTASESTVVNAVADLSVTMTDSSDPIYAGNNLTYTLDITNNGINDASSVKITDTLPTGVTFVSASTGCSEAAGEVTCNIGNLANGVSTSVNVVIKPTAPGTITNSASVSATEYDPATANNTASENTIVNAVTDMEIVSASAAPNPVYAGADLTYTVKIKNNAAEFNTAKDVKVTYTFSDDIVLDSASSCTAVGNVVTCNIGSMTYNQDVDHQLIIKPDMDGDLDADIKISSSTHDPDLNNNDTSVSTTVNPAVDIVLGMTSSADPILVGENLTYTITVTNSGPSTATNVVLTDTLPGAAPVQSFVTSQGTCINNLTTLDCNLGNIDNDMSATVTVVLRPTNGAVGTLTNSATVTNDVYERVAADNTATVSTTVNQSSKVKVSLKGKGNGTVNGTGISCPGDCEETFTRGDTVTLTATADVGSTFDRWQGGVCSGKNDTCTFTLNKPNMNVMASFK